MTKLFLIDFESAQWCGGQSNVVVHADTAEEAVLLAESHMEDVMRELFFDEIEEAFGDDGLEDCAFTVNSVEEFGPEHETWKFFEMWDQRTSFYPEIGGNYFNDCELLQ